MTNLIEKIIGGSRTISITGFYYLWWNTNKKEVWLTNIEPPKPIEITITSDGWKNHGTRCRKFNEIHEDYAHLPMYHENRMITVFNVTISKQEIEKISSIRRTLELH